MMVVVVANDDHGDACVTTERTLPFIPLVSTDLVSRARLVRPLTALFGGSGGRMRDLLLLDERENEQVSMFCGC